MLVPVDDILFRSNPKSQSALSPGKAKNAKKNKETERTGSSSSSKPIPNAFALPFNDIPPNPLTTRGTIA